MPKKNKMRKKGKNKKMRQMEKFAKEQLEKYIEIHKENGKNIRYIG